MSEGKQGHGKKKEDEELWRCNSLSISISRRWQARRQTRSQTGRQGSSTAAGGQNEGGGWLAGCSAVIGRSLQRPQQAESSALVSLLLLGVARKAKRTKSKGPSRNSEYTGLWGEDIKEDRWGA